MTEEVVQIYVYGMLRWLLTRTRPVIHDIGQEFRRRRNSGREYCERKTTARLSIKP
jgi:hypothetical protein